MTQKIMTRQQVRDYDKTAVERFAVPSVVLMENAGRGCCDIIRRDCDCSGKVVIFCGPGNNGGDGYVIARHLSIHGIENTCIVLANRDKIKGDADTNLKILEKIGADIQFIAPDDKTNINAALGGARLIVDAVFGTGLSGEVRDNFLPLIEAINTSKAGVFAVDIPSGLDCDTGKPLKAAVKADITATFVAIKKGFQHPKAAQYTGKIEVVHIGIVM